MKPQNCNWGVVLPEAYAAYYPPCESKLAELTLSQRAHRPWKTPGAPPHLSSVHKHQQIPPQIKSSHSELNSASQTFKDRKFEAKFGFQLYALRRCRQKDRCIEWNGEPTRTTLFPRVYRWEDRTILINQLTASAALIWRDLHSGPVGM